ncbi:hypothetical protein C5Z25_05290 [Lactobacillus sp. CBA3605]|uniref:LPXTG cell wall anchor domain-containing protein n=1 Tax=Lactobacillus sp. CBA3605 TaxID=2099788 RepID=UPI000CFAA775|nr:LPXTG cell wall anchor domain-containing protein [Lactobacillus sp. CBA3605]AVK61211.1 hypothetical protein C5Z25_05290 [Lactobacillus sp. CBA3605]
MMRKLMIIVLSISTWAIFNWQPAVSANTTDSQATVQFYGANKGSSSTTNDDKIQVKDDGETSSKQATTSVTKRTTRPKTATSTVTPPTGIRGWLPQTGEQLGIWLVILGVLLLLGLGTIYKKRKRGTNL